MKKKYYLEAVRITAVLLVMYNHSAPFMSFATQHGVQYAVSFFLSLVCKAAVPLFYMVSGALLLGKNESFGELARKRILRIVAVIVIFSLLYYLKFAVRGQASVSPIRFLLGLPFDVAFLPYWYLYSYLGILVSLPFLRPLAQNMPKNAFWYLIALQIVTESLQITLGFFGYHTLCGYFSVAGVLQTTLFYPVIGFGLDRYLEKQSFFGWKNILRNLTFLAAVVITWRLVYRDWQTNGGTYREMYLGVWMPLITLVIFVDLKLLFQREDLPEGLKRFLSMVGGCVFGVYLLDGFIGAGGRMDVIYQKLMPYIGYLPAFLIEIFVLFGIRVALTWVMKKLPVFRRLL